MPNPDLQLLPESSWTISSLQKSLRSGEMTCAQILQHTLDRIEEWEPRIHAWVRLDLENARQQARELDDMLRSGHSLGPLHGIPMGVKDLFDWEGWSTIAGFPPRNSHIAPRDSVVVGTLRQSGAILLGKTVTTQLASFDPSETLNPWNATRTPGGSSSGSAAAVATGMCLAAIGSQTGGSVTRPASFCGVAACKPTFRSISLEGCLPFAESLDHAGIMTKSVRDLAIISSLMCDHLLTTAEEWLSLEPAIPPRFRRLHGHFEERADPQAWQIVQLALNCWIEQQASVDDLPLPIEFAPILKNHRLLMATEAASAYRDIWKNQRHNLLPNISALLQEGYSSSAVDFLEVRHHQAQLKRIIEDWFGNADILVSPATVGGAPDRNSTGDPCMNSPWSYLGLPTLNFPLGLDSEGLPLGVQLIARHGEEDSLFRAALWCEAKWNAHHPVGKGCT